MQTKNVTYIKTCPIPHLLFKNHKHIIIHFHLNNFLVGAITLDHT